jgi:hypothetical protein
MCSFNRFYGHLVCSSSTILEPEIALILIIGTCNVRIDSGEGIDQQSSWSNIVTVALRLALHCVRNEVPSQQGDSYVGQSRTRPRNPSSRTTLLILYTRPSSVRSTYCLLWTKSPRLHYPTGFTASCTANRELRKQHSTAMSGGAACKYY